MSLAVRISVDFPDWLTIFKKPIRENCAYRKFGAIIMVYLYLLGHYRPYQTSYIYLFCCSFRTISYIMILIRHDSTCDARIARDYTPAYASYLLEVVFSSIMSTPF